jgi:hypothetical protein
MKHQETASGMPATNSKKGLRLFADFPNGIYDDAGSEKSLSGGYDSRPERQTLRRTVGTVSAVLVLTLFLVVPASASIAVDSAASANGGNANVSTLTWSQTVANGTNRILIVGISLIGVNPIASVTYGGVPLTLIGAVNRGTTNRTEMWSLLAPPVGTANVVVTMSVAGRVAGGSTSFTGVDQTTPLNTFASANGQSTTPAVNVPSAAGQLVVDTVTGPGDATPLTPGAGQTQRWQTTAGGGSNPLSGGSTKAGAAGTVPMTWTMGNHPWSIAAVSLIPAATTAVKLISFTATAFRDGVMLEWTSGFETNNLGYQLYRLENGQRSQVTPSLIAGSALVSRGTLNSGSGYGWFDPGKSASVQYILEAIDVDGTTESFTPQYELREGSRNAPVRRRSQMLTEMSDTNSAPSAESGWATHLGSPKAVNALAMTTLSAASPNRSGAPRSLVDQQTIAAERCVKIQVKKNGWYRVTQPQLVAAGFDAGANVSNLRLYADGVETPMKITGNGKTLRPSDAIEFYGIGRDEVTTDTRTYYLVRLDGPREVVTTKTGSMGTAAPAAAFSYTEERRDRVSYLPGVLNGDEGNIFGPPITASPVTQTLTLNKVVHNGAGAQLEVAVQGLTIVEHQIQVQLNGTFVGTIELSGADHTVTAFSVSDALLVDGNNTVTLTAVGGQSDITCVDWTRLTYARAYVAVNDALNFTLAPNSSAQVVGFTSAQLRVIDITNPNVPIELIPIISQSGGGYCFGINNSTVGQQSFIAFADNLAAQPASVVTNHPSKWHVSDNAADMIILTHADFRDSIKPLAAARQSQGFKVSVVDVEDVFDEFSYGAHRPTAIKDFLLWATTHWHKAPKYLLIVGDSSWDPRNYLGQGYNDFVPTKLLDTAEMETSSDDWLADFDDDGIPEMAVGRLPARTAGDANTMVSKILSYDPSRGLGRGALMVADQGFEVGSGQIGSLLSTATNVQTLNRSAINDDVQMRAEIVNSINQGPLIVNYFGHGSVTIWTGAGLLNKDNAAALTNGGRLSVFVMTTCLNSYAHDAFIDSLAEVLLKNPQGGAVATWSSSGKTAPEGQTDMNLRLYQLILNNPAMTLGDAIRNAKMKSPDIDVRHTWILLGDPSMRLLPDTPATTKAHR